MTNREFMRRYWSEADRQEDKLLRRLAKLHPEDAAQDALDRFGGADGTARLDTGQLNRLHRDIAGWKDGGILTGEFGLRARDAANRKRITNDEALLLYLMADWSEYYDAVSKEATEMYAAAANVPIKDTEERLAQPSSGAGTTLQTTLGVDAAYRARQIQKRVAMDRAQGRKPDVNAQDYRRIFDQAQRWLLAPSAPTETTPNGHHGYLDRVMAELLSYFAIEAYRRDGVREVEFVAVVDEVTTHNCRRLDGRIFDIDDLRPGINAPPIADPPHHCRSVLKPIKTLQMVSESGIILPDIEVGRSVGAAAFKDPVKLPDGRTAHLTEGTKITKVYVFAGKGTKTPIRVAVFLSKQYRVPMEDWKKVRGEGFVDVDGASKRAELHWLEADQIGRVQMKVKRWFD